MSSSSSEITQLKNMIKTQEKQLASCTRQDEECEKERSALVRDNAKQAEQLKNVAYDQERVTDPFGTFERDDDPPSRASPSWDAFAGAVNDGPTMDKARKTYADAARKPASSTPGYMRPTKASNEYARQTEAAYSRRGGRSS